MTRLDIIDKVIVVGPLQNKQPLRPGSAAKKLYLSVQRKP